MKGRGVGWRTLGVAAALVGGAFGSDQAVWLTRGSPVGTVAVSVVTAMEFKSGKEDYGDPEIDTVQCAGRALPWPGSAGMVTPCWWVRRHTEVVQRP